MASVTDLERQLDALTKLNREKEKELRKEITRAKRKRETEFTFALGKMAREAFPDYKMEEQFAEMFARMKAPVPQTYSQNSTAGFQAERNIV